MGSIDGLLQESENLPPARLEDPPLGVGKSGEAQGRQLAQGVLERVELRGDLGRARSQRRAPLVQGRRRRASGITHERFAGGRVRGGTIGGEERLSLARRERVLVDRVAEPLLLDAAQGAQRQGHRQREPSAIEPRRELRGQPPRERQPALDPEGLSSEVLGDRGFGEPVLVAQGGDDAGFVHGAGGLGGRIRVQKPRLHGPEGVDRLHDDRGFGAALGAPESQSLESVKDFERIPRGRHAKRQRREV